MHNNHQLPLISIVIPTYNRKDKLIKLLNSLTTINYPLDKLEIIIVDDCSNDGTSKVVNMFPVDRYIRHNKETLVAKSLNDGINASNSEYVFIIDDDNVIDKDIVKILYRVISKNKKIGVIGPVTYYVHHPKIIQYAGSIYSKFTRRTIHLFHNRVDDGFLKGKLIKVDGIANSFMLRKSLALKVGLIPWKRIPWNGEDGYLQYKIKKLGYDIVVVGDAKIYHDVEIEYSKRYNPMRLYYALRSKIIFHRDLDKGFQKITFFLSLPIYILYYSYVAIRNKKNILKRLKSVFDGLIDGLTQREGIRYI